MPDSQPVFQPDSGPFFSLIYGPFYGLIFGPELSGEHVISGVGRCRTVRHVFRNTKKDFRDPVTEFACGLCNFRAGCRRTLNWKGFPYFR